jgi:hypothetical protein
MCTGCREVRIIAGFPEHDDQDRSRQAVGTFGQKMDPGSNTPMIGIILKHADDLPECRAATSGRSLSTSLYQREKRNTLKPVKLICSIDRDRVTLDTRDLGW